MERDYVKEFKIDTIDRMASMVSNAVGKRITYKELVA